mmetsp:Transcript_32454/g.82011  ORF Transcript_32454/g.82011 Transcript_32454/m.82011 type:complete len:220 (-) Transcript_32454:771-1430(-)
MGNRFHTFLPSPQCLAKVSCTPGMPSVTNLALDPMAAPSFCAIAFVSASESAPWYSCPPKMQMMQASRPKSFLKRCAASVAASFLAAASLPSSASPASFASLAGLACSSLAFFLARAFGLPVDGVFVAVIGIGPGSTSLLFVFVTAGPPPEGLFFSSFSVGLEDRESWGWDFLASGVAASFCPPPVARSAFASAGIGVSLRVGLCPRDFRAPTSGDCAS